MADTATEKTDKSPAERIVESVTSLNKKIDDMSTKVDGELKTMKADLEEAKKPLYPHGPPNIRETDEDPMTSRSFSFARLAKALCARSCPGSSWYDPTNWHRYAAPEVELSQRLYDEYYGLAKGNWSGFGGGAIVPLSWQMLPAKEQEVETKDGKTLQLPGISHELRKQCRDMMVLGVEVDYDELAYHGLPIRKSHVAVQKDMSAATATTGGVLVGLAGQGELIELLRALEMFSQAGATQMDLPPQGAIRFPRTTGSVTISAVAEGATISESTPAFGSLYLSAKPYTGLTDIPEELLKFATSVNAEAWLRSEFVREIGLQADSDMISGASGGTSILGVINYSARRSVTAGTTGANGDTLDPPDPTRLFADIADQNAPVDRGFFFGMTATLWGGITTRQATTNEFIFAVGTQLAGGGRPTKSLNGETVICSTQIPTDRSKGASSNLTLLLGGVGPEWVIARAGVVEVKMTDSDASKFQQRLVTMRGTQYLDAGPRHEESFGMVDVVTNS